MMTFLLVGGAVLMPILMCLIVARRPRFARAFACAAYLAQLASGVIAALKVWEVRRTGQVLMTTIHELFLNDFFLACAGLAGLFLLYATLWLALYGQWPPLGRQAY
ncbi:hypothetical protein N8I74_15145 [Chitiniphilus purpureus]|uniref:Uncharacterized protein n=1 Tax=Chitiniphilus purpureus TaxID=2981137 RepID=A0ABY6DNF6_9NEIS|nr:hypothetical protein [Chitiniphilus sp. CD1]UXY14646.1 hypothetical protein N8I74_15145 [Chitiniphilus sp. CD1]